MFRRAEEYNRQIQQMSYTVNDVRGKRGPVVLEVGEVEHANSYLVGDDCDLRLAGILEEVLRWEGGRLRDEIGVKGCKGNACLQ